MPRHNHNTGLPTGQHCEYFITQNVEEHVNNFISLKSLALEKHATGKIIYIVAGLEKGSVTERDHFHATLRITPNSSNHGWTVARLRKEFPFFEGADIQVRSPAATWEQSIAYCLKGDGTNFEVGERPKDSIALQREGGKKGGEVTKIRYQSAIQLARENNWSKLQEEHPDLLLRFHSSLQKISTSSNNTSDRSQLLNFWISGPSGTGKSLWVRTFCLKHGIPLFVKSSTTKWWDGYPQAEANAAILIEEIGPEHRPLANVYKQITDHYPFPAEFKGGSFTIRPMYVFFTSNWTLEDIFRGPSSSEDARILDPLKRRFSEHTISVDVHGNRILKPFITILNNNPRDGDLNGFTPESIFVEGLPVSAPSSQEQTVTTTTQLVHSQSTEAGAYDDAQLMPWDEPPLVFETQSLSTQQFEQSQQMSQDTQAPMDSEPTLNTNDFAGFTQVLPSHEPDTPTTEVWVNEATQRMVEDLIDLTSDESETETIDLATPPSTPKRPKTPVNTPPAPRKATLSRERSVIQKQIDKADALRPRMSQDAHISTNSSDFIARTIQELQNLGLHDAIFLHRLNVAVAKIAWVRQRSTSAFRAAIMDWQNDHFLGSTFAEERVDLWFGIKILSKNFIRKVQQHGLENLGWDETPPESQEQFDLQAASATFRGCEHMLTVLQLEDLATVATDCFFDERLLGYESRRGRRF